MERRRVLLEEAKAPRIPSKRGAAPGTVALDGQIQTETRRRRRTSARAVPPLLMLDEHHPPFNNGRRDTC